MGVSVDEARKKLRLCLIFVVTAAIVIGGIYYFRDVRQNGDVNEGTLVRGQGTFAVTQTADRGTDYGDRN